MGTVTKNSTIMDPYGGGQPVSTTDTPTFAGETLNASNFGAELAPDMAGGSWTCTNGWSANGTVLAKTSNASNGTATPSAATTIAAGKLYKVVIVVSAISSGTDFYFTLGISNNNNYSRYILTGTNTYYVTAMDTAKLLITGVAAGAITIASISIKEITAGGGLTTEGISSINGPVSERLTVLTNTSGNYSGSAGAGLFLVNKAYANGFSISPHSTSGGWYINCSSNLTFVLPAADLVVTAGGAERFRLGASSPFNGSFYGGGNFVFGVTSNSYTPTAKLEVRGATADNTAYALAVRSTTPGDLFTVRNDGLSVVYGPLNIGAVDTGLSRTAAGTIAVGNGTAADTSGTLKLKTVQLTPLTVATLPATPAQGMRCIVTDANATTFLSTVAAGGANVVPVMYNGTNWVIG